MAEGKTHYKNVYKSNHLGVSDLEGFVEDGRSLNFTIKEVKQEIDTKVAGKTIDANIAYFKEDIKPLVLNSTNATTLSKFAKSTHVENWNNIYIELYIDKGVKMKGQIVGGIRIRKIQPVKQKPILNPQSEKWELAKEKVKGGMTIESLRKHYSITQENFELLCG